MSDTHAQTVSYVRDTMLPQQAPPLTEVGVIKWIRENLFPTPLNAILTFLSLFVVYWVVSHIGPWLFNGIWNADSLSECREIRNATLGPDASAACFAVITERWPQLIFGFYPSDAYWRPVVALMVFFVGISPVLFDKLPRKMLIGTLAAPFLMYMLLWGGSIWGPVVIGLGFVEIGRAHV